MSAEKSNSPIRVLMIEDSKGDALLLTRALQEYPDVSYTIEHAINLEQALQALSDKSFDIAFLDRTLPDATDFDGLHSIQNIAPKLPIIFLTGYSDEKTAFNAIRQGAQDYIFKEHYNGAEVRRSIHYALSRKVFESELIERAHYDILTGLANRTLFESRLEAALSRMSRQKSGLAVFFLDLDGFKQVNDTYGHLVGDKLLTEIGQRIKLCLRGHDVAARFGGDEFALLIENVDDRKSCESVGQKIIETCAQPIVISGRNIVVGVSIGIAQCTADQPYSGDDLVRCADKAMYQAKALAHSAYCFHEGEKAL